jgi:hypothetical protein
VEIPDSVPRPACVDRAFVLWMVLAVPSVLYLVGIALVVAAFHLRAGYRGARLLFSIVACFYLLPVLLTVFGFLLSSPPVPGWLALFVFVPVGIVVTSATVLMWRPEATAYFDAMRDPAVRGSTY